MRLMQTSILLITAGLALGLSGCSRARNSSVTPAQVKVLNYDLHLTPDFVNSGLTGCCVLTVENRSGKPLPYIPLLLYRALFVDRSRDENGRKLRFRQGVSSFRDWGEYQANAIQVYPSRPLAPGESATIQLDYHGWLMGYAETGMRYIRDRVQEDFTILRPDCLVYPSVGVPEWAANRSAGLQWFDYTLRVTVPPEYTVANGGREVERIAGVGGVTWAFRNIRRAWRMDAAISRYRVLRKGNSRVYYFPEDEAGARRVMQAMNDALGRYSGWFGPLEDFRGFAVIEIPEGWGSQADVTSIIQTAAAFRNPDNLHQVYHEISHQWNVEAIDPLPSRLESEGMATYLQYRLLEEIGGRKGALEKGVRHCLERFRRQCGDNPAAADVPMADYGSHKLTGLSYTKGMVFFALLNRFMGDDAFGAAVGSFYRRYHRDGATLEQFTDHFQSNSPRDLRGLFRDWIYESRSSRWILNGEGWKELKNRYEEA